MLRLTSTLKHILTILMTWISISSAISQCNGTITLSTQAQVNDFSCNTVNGNLTITGSGITHLDSLFGILNVLQNVTGNLIVTNCPNLTSLQGLDGVQDVGGEFIVNNTGITTFGNFAFQLVSAGEFFIIDNNSLSSISINGGGDAFPFLTSVGIFAINTNASVTSISGFSSLNTVNAFALSSNSNLVDVSAFQDLNVSEGVIITSNPQLSLCCFAEYMLNNNMGSDVIDGNASGCANVAEIMAPPVLSPCPANSTVSASASTCGASVSFTDPGIIDNCGIDTYTALITLGDGTIYFSGNAVPGLMFTYPLTVGNNTFVYTATDTGGNTSTCSTTVTVIDNVPPVFPSPSQTITGICGVDDPNTLFFANAPTATDNCGVATYADPFVDTPLCGSSLRRTYTSTATDVNGNVSLPFTTIINILDNQAPQLSGIPADVTIYCGDPTPSTPSVQAFDQCQGNVSGNITVVSSIALGNCTFNTPAEITTFTWTATDGCNNSSSDTWIITRMNNFTFDLGPDVNVCNQASYTINPGPVGTSYLWSTGATTQSINVTASGTYSLTVTQSPGCCHADIVNVQFGTPPNASATGNQLNCTGTPVTIMGTSSTPPVTYAWSGQGGYTSAIQNPTVSVAGTYTLTVTNNQGCTSTANAIVTVNNAVPNVTTTGGAITCTATSVTITAASTTSGVTYAWTGPGGFTSSLPNPTVSTDGTYNVVVTAPNNCIANGAALVTLNNTLPTSSLSAGALTCTTTSTQIVNTPSANAVSYIWTGPNNFTSTAQSPSVTTGGNYFVTVTANNGCTSTNQIAVSQNTTAPNVTAQGGAIPCGSSTLLLQGNSTAAGAAFAWSGPGGYTSGLQNPQVSIIGTYTLVVTAPNGCTAQASAIVVSDANAPVVTTTGGSITCTTTTAVISATSSIANSTFLWSGPNGFTSTMASNTLGVTGVYIVEVSSPNNCKTTSTATIINDTSVPSIAIALGAVDCAASSRTLLATSSLSNPTFAWTGPNGFTSTLPNPSITKSGTYIATTVGSNGCRGQNNIIIAHDIAYTHVITSTDATATTGGTASIAITGGTPTFNIVWDNGQAGSSATNLSTGNHNVIVVDGLGCTKVIPFVIMGPVGTKEDQLAQSIGLVPNPAIDHIRLETLSTVEIKYSIINSVGSVVISPSTYQDMIDISALRPGLYTIQLVIDGKKASKKFIKI